MTARAAGQRGGGASPLRYRAGTPRLDRADAWLTAAVTAEDARFWAHSGIDWHEVRRRAGLSARQVRLGLEPRRARAVAGGGERLPGRREAIRGASTITQQVAKNLYLSSSRNPLRKMKEAVTAYRLELVLPKRRILELYLNIAELGDGVWGVEAASRRYYRKPARRLTETQAAALAATLPFPLSSNPAYRPVQDAEAAGPDPAADAGGADRGAAGTGGADPAPGDSIMWTPGIDSLVDSLRAPVETLSAPDRARSAQSTSRSGITSVR